jgi:thioredoxin-like negative regulator of GroEL
MRRVLSFLVGITALAALAAFTYLGRRERDELHEAIRAADEGRFAEALPVLARYSGGGSARDDVLLALGVCEKASGRTDAAIAAWSAIPEGSPSAGRAALFRSREAIRRHRFAEAEPLLRRALGEPKELGAEARSTLAHILKIQGRLNEVVALLTADPKIDRPAAAVELIRELWRLDVEPFPVDQIRRQLERARAEAHDDLRVRLGLANLARVQGRLDEADRLLASCERPTPHDPAVLRARIAWASAAEQPEAAASKILRLPPGSLSPTEVLRLRAWLASRRGDASSERRHLEAIDRLGDTGARELERLAELAVLAGMAEEADAYRRRKAERDHDQARYHATLFGPRPLDHTAELGRLAEALGRRFDARVWWGLSARHDPGGPEMIAALDRLRVLRSPPDGASLSDLQADARGLVARAKRRGRPEAGTARFEDASARSGLAFRFENGDASPPKQLPTTMAGGVGLLDFDGDGWLDVFVVQGGVFPPRDGQPCSDRLYRNRGDGTFEDVSTPSGVAALPGGYGHGVAVGDIDGDGHPDLFLARWRRYALWRNRGDGRFEDVTEAWGLGGDRDWPTSAAFADFDGDGDLDLYVCHYSVWDEARPPLCRDPRDRDRAIHCPPEGLAARQDRIYRNDGGRFTDLTEAAGIVVPEGRSLGVVATDLDGDGRVDLFVACDMAANLAFRNLGGFRFEECASLRGLASNADGGYLAGMGVACGDLDGDGRADLAVTNFYGESTRYYRNLGLGQFADHAQPIGLASASRYLLGFGAAFLDADNDGHLDLLTANGHVEDLRPDAPWTMPAQLLLGSGDGRLVDATAKAGPALLAPRLGRGLAAGDLDNDGDVDALILDEAGPLADLRNAGTPSRHWLVLGLEGVASNRDAVGAEVVVEAAGRARHAWRFGGGSYQSAGDPRLHLGLGSAGRADRVEVRWPSGRVDVFRGLEADSGYLLREGAGSAMPLSGFGPATRIR